MNCPRCKAELPATASFCSSCGLPLGAAAAAGREFHGGAVSAAAAAARRKRLALAAAAVALLALGGMGYLLLAHRPVEPVTERTAVPSTPAPLIARTNPVPPGPPQEVVDYLAFLKDMERQRISLSKKDLAAALVISTRMEASNLTSQMTDPSEQSGQQTAQPGNAFQDYLSTVATQWQQLSAQFRAKQPPPECATLADAYYEVLRQTTAALSSIGTSMSQALSGNADAAIQNLTAMQGSGLGSASGTITDACSTADDQLAKVCSKYGIRKDFAIRDDNSGASLLGR